MLLLPTCDHITQVGSGGIAILRRNWHVSSLLLGLFRRQPLLDNLSLLRLSKLLHLVLHHARRLAFGASLSKLLPLVLHHVRRLAVGAPLFRAALRRGAGTNRVGFHNDFHRARRN